MYSVFLLLLLLLLWGISHLIFFIDKILYFFLKKNWNPWWTVWKCRCLNSFVMMLLCSGQRRTMFIQTQSTPNPASLMFYPGKPVMEVGSADFPNSRSAMSSPLAKSLYGIDGKFVLFWCLCVCLYIWVNMLANLFYEYLIRITLAWTVFQEIWKEFEGLRLELVENIFLQILYSLYDKHGCGYEILVECSYFTLGGTVWFLNWYPFILSTFLVIITLEKKKTLLKNELL